MFITLSADFAIACTSVPKRVLRVAVFIILHFPYAVLIENRRYEVLFVYFLKSAGYLDFNVLLSRRSWDTLFHVPIDRLAIHRQQHFNVFLNLSGIEAYT